MWKKKGYANYTKSRENFHKEQLVFIRLKQEYSGCRNRYWESTVKRFLGNYLKVQFRTKDVSRIFKNTRIVRNWEFERFTSFISHIWHYGILDQTKIKILFTRFYGKVFRRLNLQLLTYSKFFATLNYYVKSYSGVSSAITATANI